MDGWKNSGIYERGLKRFQFFFLPVFQPCSQRSLSVKDFFLKVLGSNMIIAAAATPPPPPPPPLPSRNHMPRTIEVKNKNTL